MKASRLLFVILAIAVTVSACQSRVVPISSRGDLADKAGTGPLFIHRNGEQPKKAPEIFMRRTDLKITDSSGGNETGSLFNLEDERNYLFAHRGPVVEGNHVTIEVASNRVESKEAGVDAKKGAAEAHLRKMRWKLVFLRRFLT